MPRPQWPPVYANVPIAALLDEHIPHGAFRFYAKLRALSWGEPTLSIPLAELMRLTDLSQTRVYEYARLLRDRNGLLFHCAQSVFECSFPDMREIPEKREMPNPLVKETAKTKKQPIKQEIPNSRISEKRESGNLYPLAQALGEVCRMNFEPNKGRLLAEAKRLSAGTPPATPELLRQHYNGHPQSFWRSQDWRGKKGEAPNPATIRETWGQWALAPMIEPTKYKDFN